MHYLIIIAIIVILVLNDKVNQLKKENEYLKKNNFPPKRALLSFCPKCGNDLRNYKIPESQIVIPSNKIPENNLPLPQPNNEIKVKESILSKEEQKNNIILITGAILIVLSAIIFLLSTWGSTGNITKTIILLLMLVIFFLTSKISEKVFHLKQTSQVFYYIALSYIPIALFSISLFGLFGHYLSIFGSGKYIYFSLSSLLISIIYIYSYQKHNTIFLKVMSELFLITTVIFVSLSLTSNFYIQGILLVIYLIIRQYISIKMNNIKDIDKIIYIVLSVYSILRINVFGFMSFLDSGFSILYPIYTTLVLLDIYMILKKIINQPTIYNYIYPLFTIFIFTLFANVKIFNFDYSIKQVIILLSFIPLILFDIFTSKKIKISTYLSITIASILLVLSTNENNLYPSIIISIYLIISIINYIENKENRSLLSLLNSFIIIILSLYLKQDFDLPLFTIVFVPSILLIIPLLFKKLDSNIIKSSTIIGTISLCLELLYLSIFNSSYTTIIFSFIGTIIFIIYFLKDKKEYNKYLSYFLLSLSLINIFTILEIEYSVTYGLSLSSILIILIESLISIFETENSFIYILILSIISLILLNINISIINLIIISIIDISLVYYNIVNNKDSNIYYVIGLSLINSIFFSNLLMYHHLNIMILISIFIIGLTTYLSYIFKEDIQYVILSYTYIFFTIICFDLSTYINMGLLILTSVVQLISKLKNKDLFKFIIYTSLLVLLRQLFKDLDLLSVTTINIGMYLIYSLIVIRTIIKNHFNDYKFIEYFITSVINIIAIINYNSELDGILYVSLLIGLIIIGYTSKFGPVFLTSIIFVILNALILTREFWFSIPWWIYVLGIGIILVLFAIRNEAHNNDTKSKLEELKKNLDL